ncbi:MAG: oligosaccharide flippase family protein [Bdellovibrionales bacterium]|nr:oligosaccharide flippase family protein [Bdellovibrionales bacterium]
MKTSIAKDTLIYSVGRWLIRLFSFVLLPIYTRLFSPDEYGTLEILTTFTSLLVLFSTLGLDGALSRFFCDEEYKDRQADIFSGVFLLFGLLSAGLLLGIVLGAGEVARFLQLELAHANLLRMALAAAMTSMLIDNLLRVLRLRFLATEFTIVSISYFFVSFVLTLLFILVLGFKLEGIFIARLLSDALFIPILLFMNRTYIKWTMDFPLLKEMITFGFPLLAGWLTLYGIRHTDRYFVLYYLDLEQLGYYGVAIKLANVVDVIVAGFQLAWPAYIWSRYTEQDAPENFGLIFKFMSVILFMTLVPVGLFAQELLSVLTTAKFARGADAAGLLLIGSAVSYLLTHFSIGIDVRKQSYHRITGGLLALMLNLVLNFYLVPMWGIVGAAIATIVSYTSYGAFLMLISQKMYRIPITFHRHALLWGTGLIFICLERLWYQQYQSSMMLLGSKITVVAFLASLPFLFGLLTLSEITKSYRMAKEYLTASLRLEDRNVS